MARQPACSTWLARIVCLKGTEAAPRDVAPGSADVGVQLLEELTLALGTDDPQLGLPVLEQDHGGNAHDLEAACQLQVLVDVDLAQTQLAWVVRNDLVQDGSHHL